MNEIVTKKAFVANFIYVVVGLLIAVTVLPILDNAINSYAGSYATLIKLVTLVVVAGLVFVGMRFGLGGMSK
jgi:hypothetical protein